MSDHDRRLMIRLVIALALLGAAHIIWTLVRLDMTGVCE